MLELVFRVKNKFNSIKKILYWLAHQSEKNQVGALRMKNWWNKYKIKNGKSVILTRLVGSWDFWSLAARNCSGAARYHVGKRGNTVKAVILQRHRMEVPPAFKMRWLGPHQLPVSLLGLELKRLSVGKEGISPASEQRRRYKAVDCIRSLTELRAQEIKPEGDNTSGLQKISWGSGESHGIIRRTLASNLALPLQFTAQSRLCAPSGLGNKADVPVPPVPSDDKEEML